MTNSDYIGIALTTLSGVERLGYFWCRHREISIESLKQKATYHNALKGKRLRRIINKQDYVKACDGQIATPNIDKNETQIILSYNKEKLEH